ncbi:MAG: LCP family protein [Lachnospiraceae bacterium]|nr:LCP family protein [Lachnospiraceae bacterium]
MAKYDSDDFSNFFNPDSDSSGIEPAIDSQFERKDRSNYGNGGQRRAGSNSGNGGQRRTGANSSGNTNGNSSANGNRRAGTNSGNGGQSRTGDNSNYYGNQRNKTNGNSDMNNQRPSTAELKMKEKYRKSKKLGIILTLIQLIASVAFMTILYFAKDNLDAFVTLPVYIGAGVVLFLLFIMTFRMQFKKLTVKRIGKVISIIITVLLVLGSYFLYPLIGMELGGNSVVSHNKPFVVYLSGNDTFDELSKDSNGRSDTNILAVVNPETYTALLLSTPRDAYLELNGQDIPAGNMDKLTHAGLYGNGIKDANGKWGYGCDVSMNMLGDLYDLDVKHYLRINFTGFSNLVDALGGVTVDVPEGFTTTTYGKTYTFKEGKQKLDGSYALTFVRERHSFAKGDMQRGANQTAVIKAIVDQAVSANSIVNYNKVVDSISESFDTDLNVSSLAKLQLQLQRKKDFKGWNIVNYAVDGSTGGGYKYCYTLGKNASVVVLDDDSVEIGKQMAHLVLDGKHIDDKTAKQLEKGTYVEDETTAK